MVKEKEMEKGKFFTVGELARRCGVTVRTLQFYDKEGLLSPGNYTEGGRRLYSRSDIIRLQQILFFKSFGFKLDKIRERLTEADSSEKLRLMLVKQRGALMEQTVKIQEIIRCLDKVIAETSQDKPISSEKLVMMMEMMKTGNPYIFILDYFDQNHLEVLLNWNEKNREEKGDGRGWEELFMEVIRLHQEGEAPEGLKGQDLAARWWAMVQSYTEGDPAIMNNLISMGKDVDNWPEEAGDLKQAVKSFLAKAMEKYLLESGKEV